MGVAVSPTAAASVFNHETELKFSQPVEMPGTILPAGNYVLKLMDSEADAMSFNCGAKTNPS